MPTRRPRLLAMACLGLGLACATPSGMAPPPPPPSEVCQAGQPKACEAWAAQLGAEGNAEGAQQAYGLACKQGQPDDCLAQGRLLVSIGDLVRSEPPLQQACAARSEEGCAALAELYERRGTPEDLALAEQVRFEAVAVNVSDAEVAVLYRYGSIEGSSWGLQFGLQPMAFLARRLNIGGDLYMDQRGLLAEANVRFAYQYFVNSTVLPYLAMELGSVPHLASRNHFNLGTELGLKVNLGPVGSVNIAVGSSRASPAHVQVGLGLDWEIVLAILAQMH